MDYDKLLDKLRRIEALHAGATTSGERVAAENALVRILARLATTEKTDPPIEYRFTLPDPWTRKLFFALVRRYGLKPYRYPRQRASTVRVRVSRQFVDDVLWPEFVELSTVLHSSLEEVTARMVATALQADTSEPEEKPEPQALSFSAD